VIASGQYTDHSYHALVFIAYTHFTAYNTTSYRNATRCHGGQWA